MATRAPTFKQVAIAVAFAFSCFGLMLFLWSAFGGPIPLSAEGYRVNVPFNEATQLAVESDVRISGVSVGKVKKIELNEDGYADATLEIDAQYAPIPDDTRAILRQKTLLGETYVELTPGSDSAPDVPEGGSLPRANVSNAVQLDEIFRTFDERTRLAFQAWMQGAAVAFDGRGADLSAALADLGPFAEDADRTLRVLDTQRRAVGQLVRNGGVVFDALSTRQGQLRGLIQNSNTVFTTTARRNQDLEATFEALPTFEDESRKTLVRLQRFAHHTDPLVNQLRPAARQLSPAIKNLTEAAPHLHRFFVGFKKIGDKSGTAFPALRAILNTDLPPILTAFHPFARQVNPLLQGAGLYKRELTSFLANATGATLATNKTPESNFTSVHYLRTFNPLSPESVAAFPNRLKINRPNPYFSPGGYLDAGNLESFETRQCASGITATLTNGGATPLPANYFNEVKQFAFDNQNSTATVPTPPCIQQPQVNSIGEIPELSTYLHVYQDAP